MTKKTVKTVKPTKVPGIPQPPNDTPPGMRRYLEALSEAVEIRLGRRGDQRDRAITLRELIDSGLAVELSKTPYDPDRGNQTFTSYETAAETAVEEPDPPTGFTAAGGYELISLFWDYPTYRGHSLTEVWRHTSDVIGDAQLIGVTGGTSYVDPVGESASFYYWIRHVNERGNQGDFNSANGTLAETSPNVNLLLNELADSISESELTDTLSGRIDLVDGAASVPGSVANQISCVTASINATAQNLANEITNRSSVISCVTASINATTQNLANEITNRSSVISCVTASINATAQNLANEITNRSSVISCVTASINATSANLATEISNRTTAINCASAALNASIAALSDVAAYDNAVQYDIGDLVVSNSTIYRAIAQTTGNAPPNSSYWVSRGSYTNIVDFVEVSASETTDVLSSLRSDYFTETCARTAIAAAVLNLASETFVTDQLSHYTTTASLQQTYFTETCARTAIAAAVLNLASETFVTNELSHYTTTANLQQNFFTETCARAAISAATLDLKADIGEFDPFVVWDFSNSVDAWSAPTSDLTAQDTSINVDVSDDGAAGSLLPNLSFDFTDEIYVDNATPQFQSPSGLSIPGARNRVVRARIKRISGTGWDGRLYYKTASHGWSENYYAETSIQLPINTWRIVEWDMAFLYEGGNDWVTSTITQIGFDLSSVPDDEFEIDWVDVGTKAPFSYTSNLEQNYFTKADTTSAIATATLGLVSATDLSNELSHYTTTASLQQNYFTETCARTAIAAAVLNLASETFVTNQLSHYTTTASLQQNYFTETCARTAIAAAVLNLASETFVTNQLSHYTTTASLQQNYFTETCARTAIAAAVLNLASETFVTNQLSHYTTTASLQQNYFTETCARTAIAAAVLNLASETFVTDQLSHYTTTASLQQNYFTETCARTAIAAAVLNLASETFVTNQLSHYTTTASLQQNYFTETCARTAIAAAVLNLASETFVTDQLSHYTTTASLQQNYFTETCARTAIAAAVLNLASETFVTNQLSHYTTTASLQQNYFTETCARTAIAAAVLNLASETFVTNQLSHYTTTASLQQNYFTETCARTAIAAAVLNLASETFVTNQLSHYTTTASLQQNYFTETCARTAIAAAVLNLASETFVTDQLSHYTTTASLQQNYFTETCARTAIAAAVLNLASETFVTNQLSHYTTTASLQQNYFTETCARTAIAAAVLNLASETFVTNQLSHYTTTASLQQNYFTETCARTAIAAAVLNLASETFVTNQLSHYTTTASLQQNYFTETCARSAIAAAVLDLASETFVNNQLSHYTTTASLQQNYFTETCARAAISAATLDLKSDISEFDASIVWDFAESVSGWTALRNKLTPNSSTLSFADGNFAAASLLPPLVMSFDQGVYVPAYQPDFASPSGLSIDGARNTIVKVRLKRLSGTGWVGRMYYTTSAHGFSTQYYKDISDDTATGRYRILEWDAAELTAGGSDWTDNTITQIGFDFGEANDEFEVDFVAIGTKSPFAYTAHLEQNYFTRADTNSAIATATLGLVSTTDLSNELSHYTTTASLQQNFVAQSCLTGAIASAGLALSTSVGDNNVTLQTMNTSIDGVTAQNFIKIDNAGHISGYGLSSTNADGAVTAEFGVRADQFWVAPAAIASNTAPTTNLFAGKVWVDTSGSEDVTKYYTGNAWSTTPQALPFVIQTAPTTLNGVTVPAGVYIDQAFIKNGSIVNAQIADATIDKAKIASLDVDDVTAGTLSANHIAIDSVGLDTATINGVESLILRSGGVFVDNLSIDSVGIVKFALNNAYVGASNQSVPFSDFTSSSPYYEATVVYTDPETGFTETSTATLPTILTLTINNGSTSATSDLKEPNTDYYIDFGAAIIGSASNSSSTSSSALVLSVKQRNSGSTGSYSDYQQFGTHNTQNGALPLIPIDGMVKVTLSNTKDYQINLHGYIKGIDLTSGSQRGFSNRRMRLFRIAKASS